MSFDRVRGLSAAQGLFDSLDAGARVGLGVMLGDIGQMILDAQEQDVPVATGVLKSGLSIQLLVQQLRVRIGLITTRRGRSKRFYGRFVEFGRRAQVVLVQRRRRVKGRLRTARGRKIAADLSATYALDVKPRAARPFVFNDRVDLDRRIDQRIADYWSFAFKAAGAGE